MQMFEYFILGPPYKRKGKHAEDGRISKISSFINGIVVLAE
jgi:hypothetical protein